MRCADWYYWYYWRPFFLSMGDTTDFGAAWIGCLLSCFQKHRSAGVEKYLEILIYFKFKLDLLEPMDADCFKCLHLHMSLLGKKLFLVVLTQVSLFLMVHNLFHFVVFLVHIPNEQMRIIWVIWIYAYIGFIFLCLFS